MIFTPFRMNEITMRKYADRVDAGRELARTLKTYADRCDAIVLALPRGGVPVAFEVASALHLPLDVFIVRKLGVPGQVEFAMGAIATGGVHVLNEDIIKSNQVSESDLAQVISQEQTELARRETVYRGKKPPLNLKGKLVILVDDGIATGATMRVAIKALRVFQPKSIVIAVPVVEKNVAEKMLLIADVVVCPLTPSILEAVGMHYDDFAQTTDEEVHALLVRALKREGS
jgi:putative phosphoribosyl transferase